MTDLNEAASWRALANCRDQDAESFFLESAGGVRAAKRICRQCPVRRACLEFAMATDNTYRYGVFGGLSAWERRKLATRRGGKALRSNAPRCGTESAYRSHYTRGEKPCHACRRAMNDANHRRKAAHEQKAATA